MQQLSAFSFPPARFSRSAVDICHSKNTVRRLNSIQFEFYNNYIYTHVYQVNISDSGCAFNAGNNTFSKQNLHVVTSAAEAVILTSVFSMIVTISTEATTKRPNSTT
jgi:hypothetical protein